VLLVVLLLARVVGKVVLGTCSSGFNFVVC